MPPTFPGLPPPLNDMANGFCGAYSPKERLPIVRGEETLPLTSLADLPPRKQQ